MHTVNAVNFSLQEVKSLISSLVFSQFFFFKCKHILKVLNKKCKGQSGQAEIVCTKTDLYNTQYATHLVVLKTQVEHHQKLSNKSKETQSSISLRLYRAEQSNRCSMFNVVAKTKHVILRHHTGTCFKKIHTYFIATPESKPHVRDTV